MKTVVESPQRRLRRELGLPERGSGRTCAGDWMKVNCGDSVYRGDDPRHCGRVEAIHNSALVKVKWDDTGWIEIIELRELQHAK